MMMSELNEFRIAHNFGFKDIEDASHSILNFEFMHEHGEAVQTLFRWS